MKFEEKVEKILEGKLKPVKSLKDLRQLARKNKQYEKVIKIMAKNYGAPAGIDAGDAYSLLVNKAHELGTSDDIINDINNDVIASMGK